MATEIDWSLTTWEGSRRDQHRAFLALSFREKLEVVEHLGEVAAHFAHDRQGRGRLADGWAPARGRGPAD